MLQLVDVHKTYEGQPLLRGISLAVGRGETICLLGASGSGKSTLLRIIAGLESPEAGQVLWGGHDLASTPPHLRDFGLVFQDYALFPHLDVFENVAFGLTMRNWPGDRTNRRVAEVLDLVSMQGLARRNVTDLSGGEQQRVALARALAPRPRLLMLDEPLGALDRTLKQDLLGELRTILHRTRVPAIYVTHDQEEAFAIAGRVLLLHEGQIVRQGRPAEVWAHPGSAWAARFLGLGNVLDGKVIRGKNGKWKVDSELGSFTVKCTHKHAAGDKVHLLARPLGVRSRGVSLEIGEGSVIRGRVQEVLFQQDHYKVGLGHGLFVYLRKAPRVGRKVAVRVAVECLA